MGKVIDGVFKKYDPPVEKLLHASSTFIEGIVLCGLYVIDIITTDNSKIKDVSYKVLILMLRDMLENMDSASVLVKHGCTKGAIPSLRAVFELYLSIVFIIKDTSGNSAIAYDVCHIHKN